jgi:hypothetical protein
LTAVLDLLRSLRTQRRKTVRALRSIPDEALTLHVGPRRNDDVRAVLLSLGQDDDERAAALGEVFAAVGWHRPDAPRILASLAQTRGELRAALVALTDDLLDTAPAPGEWSVRQTLQHLMNNERRFVLDTAHAIARLDDLALPVERADPSRGSGTLGEEVPGDLEAVLSALEQVRDEVTAVAMPLDHHQLATPTVWAGQEVDTRFMLHRRATHERQHLVQIQKTLVSLAHAPREAGLLLGKAETARAALEGLVLGVPDDFPGGVQVEHLSGLHRILEQACLDEARKVESIIEATT